jgi:hypothetical protein
MLRVGQNMNFYPVANEVQQASRTAFENLFKEK